MDDMIYHASRENHLHRFGSCEIGRIPIKVSEPRLRRDETVASLVGRLTQAKEDAEAANAAKSEFLAAMSHDIRTPISAILGMANVMRLGGVSPEQAEHLDKIDKASKYLLELINKVLDFSKIEAGKFTLDTRPLSIATLAEDACALVADLAQSKGISLCVECDSFPEHLQGDSTRLQQALLNYVTNAIKFTESGTVTVRVLRQHDLPDGIVVRFEVQDTGVGIPPEVLPRLFKPFEQASRSTFRQHGGSGLGLAITACLAELMKGQVGVQSRVGLGSTFWFSAWLKKGAAPAEAKMKTDRSEGHADHAAARVDAADRLRHERFKGRRILLVEDDPVSCFATQSLLEAVGLVVDTAEDGLLAFNKAGETMYDAVLMDMQLPGVDGPTAVGLIRNLSGYLNVPILAVTANVFGEDRERSLAVGMNDFLPKPFSPDLLYSTLLKWLEA